jgi:hypothetical protein
MVDQSAMGAATLETVAQCPSWAAALGYMGVACAVCLSNWGAAVRSFPTSIWRRFSRQDRFLKTNSLTYAYHVFCRWEHGSLVLVLFIQGYGILDLL